MYVSVYIHQEVLEEVGNIICEIDLNKEKGRQKSKLHFITSLTSYYEWQISFPFLIIFGDKTQSGINGRI